MNTRQRTCVYPKKTTVRHGPSPWHIAVVRGAVAAAALRFGTRLSAESIDDVVQDTFLKLWKARARLDRLPYLRAAAANATADLLRYQNAQKRTLPRALARDLALTFWAPTRTPEEILIARQEAHRLLAGDRRLRTRVERVMRRRTADNVTN